MTLRRPRPADAMAGHFTLEPFKVYAEPELLSAPIHVPGVCFLPQCSKSFDPKRVWSIYCCTACEAKATAEMRKWGHRMALPLLLHRQDKYNSTDPDIMARTKAARRYVGQVQTAWVRDRQLRLEIAGAK